MGYGGIIKKVVRVAASVVGGMACGPPCAAIGAAVATAATGGSFKESLMAGATSFVGSSITQGISSAAGDALASGTSAAFDPAAGFADFAVEAGGTGATGGLFEASLANLAGTSLSEIPVVGDVTDALGSQFDVGNFGQIGETVRSGFDLLSSSGEQLLGEGGLGFDVTPLAINNAADLAAAGIGSLAELTLTQALNADLPGLDDVLSQKYSPEQIQILRNEARNALSQQTFERLQLETTNPGLLEEEFNKILASGIESRNIGLGSDVTEAQFREVFDTPELGNIILGEEGASRREGFQQEIGQAFPGDLFQSLDDSIIDSIVAERRGPAEQQISTFEARGNLNPLGGKTAAQEIEAQTPFARERVGEIGAGVLSSARGDIGDVRERATQAAGAFQLGDPLFDITPFSQERSDVIATREAGLGEDVRTAIGTEPLFNVSGALQKAGRAQGVVSGSPKQSFLDAIAAREGSPSRRTSRGLGSRGSGVF